MQDWKSIVAWLSRKGQFSGYDELGNNFTRKTGENSDDVEYPFPYMIRRLLKNYEPEIQDCMYCHDTQYYINQPILFLVRVDKPMLLHLQDGEEMLQQAILTLAGKVNRYINDEDTVNIK